MEEVVDLVGVIPGIMTVIMEEDPGHIQMQAIGMDMLSFLLSPNSPLPPPPQSKANPFG